MAFRVSPGVTVTEKDFTNVVPAVSTTSAGYAGSFNWGPIEQRVLVANENELVNLFEAPDDGNYKGWLAAANFLGYGGALTVVRGTSGGALNAAPSGGVSAALIKNSDVHSAGSTVATGLYSAGAGVEFFSKYAGSLGNSLRVSYAENGPTAGLSGQGINGIPVGISHGHTSGDTSIFFGITHAIASGGSAGATAFVSGDILKFSTLTKKFTITGISSGASGQFVHISPALTANLAAGVTATWEYAYKSYTTRARTSNNLDFNGGTGDQFSVVIVDQNGKFSGVTGNVLEVYNNVSKAIDAKDGDGNSNYYVDVINRKSAYVWVGGQIVSQVTGDGNSAAGTTFGNDAATFSPTVRKYHDLSGGAYGTPSNTDMLTAWNLFSDPDTVDVSLLVSGEADATLAGNVVDIADSRKDCVAFVSPEHGDVVDVTLISTQVANVVDYRDNQLNKNSSYAFLDSGWKFQYDRYNDRLRWVPLNGDMAGLCARTDNVNDPWFSPAGFNRGQIRGVVKLAMNPTLEAHRDELYSNNINPVVAFPGEGTVLFGDKTLQSKQSAFDRLNVRRLFIVLEKAVSTASKFQLFEQNDTFTRAQFKNMVEPFLRDIQGRRGITDFKVVCDVTNNTSTVIDNNRFVADIFVKPTRSINYIQLNFVATRSGVDFTEVAGG